MAAAAREAAPVPAFGHVVVASGAALEEAAGKSSRTGSSGELGPGQGDGGDDDVAPEALPHSLVGAVGVKFILAGAATAATALGEGGEGGGLAFGGLFGDEDGGVGFENLRADFG